MKKTKREMKNRDGRAWRARNPDKCKAHQAVFRALRNGKLKRGNCFCGLVGEAHHEDYTKHLEVEWLCKKHHAERDVRRRRLSTTTLSRSSDSKVE